jgi:hypothetical protein
MGGYVGKAVAANDGGCIELWVWHDGTFPFTDEGQPDARPPVQLHHCVPEQFIEFGEFLASLNQSETQK